jgi:hypothetical protein
MGVEILDRTALEAFIPGNTESARAQKFLLPLMAKGANTFIKNASTGMYGLQIGDALLPVSVSESNTENCWVCSPYGQYVGYASDEIQDIDSAAIRLPLKALLAAMGPLFCKTEIDKVVMVNNWLVSTNLYPDVDPTLLSEATSMLRDRFPGHAIAFRSICREEQPRLTKHLSACGYTLLVNRRVHLTDATSSRPFKSRMFKSDLKILKNTDYTLITGDEILDEEIPRLLELYELLYLKKHSTRNPQLTPDFVRLALRERIMEFQALRKNGRIDAVVGFYCCSGRVTSPFFGYDTALPAELGLYRMISTILSLYAKENGLVLNGSSGAGSYKRLRRAETHVEYLAVNTSHLPLLRRLPWAVLRGAVNTVGLKFMEAFDV